MVKAGGGSVLARNVTGVRVWFGRADNDRTDLAELAILTDALPATIILVK